MPKIGVKIDGVMVAVFIAIGAAVYVYTQKDKIVASINPADENNLIHQAVAGDDGVIDSVQVGFAWLDKINPFNEEDGI